MAAIKYDELFDFPGYTKAIKDVEGANKDFGKVVNTINDRIAAQVKSLQSEYGELIGVLKNYNVNQRGAGESIAKTGEAALGAAKKMAEQKRVMQEIIGVSDLTSKALNDIKAAAKAVEQEYSKLSGRSDDVRAKKQALAEEFKRLTAAAKLEAAALKATTPVLHAAEGSYQALQSQLSKVGKELKALPNAFDATTGKLNKNNKEAVALSKTYVQLNNTLKTADAHLGNYQRNVGNYSSAIGGGIKGIVGNLGALIGITSAFQGLSFIVNTNKDLESLDQAMKLVSGTSQELAINQEFLTRVIDDFGLEIIDTTRSFKNFYASSTLAGISAKDTRNIFESVTKSAANMKLSQQDVNGVLVAFGQIASKGKVQAEELRGQIGERLPGAFSIAAKAMGVTQQALNKMLEDGKLLSAEFLPKFAVELEKTFGKTDRIEGMQASINRLNNAITRLATDNEGGLNKLFTNIVNGATNAIEALDKVISVLSDLGETIAQGESTPGAFAVEEAAKFSDSYKKEIDAVTKTSLGFFSMYDKAIQAGKVTEKEATEELLKNLKKRNTEREKEIAIQRKNVQLSGETKKAYAGLVVDFLGTQKAIAQLETKLAPVAPTDKTLTDEGKKKGKTREQLLAEAVKKEQEILEAAAQKRIALFELAKANEIINEEELQAQKFAIIVKFTEQAIALEKTKGKNADKKAIEDFGKKRIDAEIDYQKFLNKTAAERLEQQKEAIKNEADIKIQAVKDEQENILSSKQLTDRERKALEVQYHNDIDAILIDSLDRRIKLETDAAKKIALEREKADLERGINTRNRTFDEGNIEKKYQTEIKAAQTAFDIIKAGRDTSFKEELAFLERLKAIKIKYAKETAEEELAIAELKAEYERQLREELEETIVQGITTGLEIAQNIVDGKFEERIANLETEKQKELDLAGNNAAARVAIEEKFNKKIAEQKNKQAKADRAFALFNVAINTAQAIAKTIAQFGMPFAIPFIALAAIQGGLQAAAILSRPLPKYKKGRKGGPAEYAVVDEEGPELIIDKHGRLKEVGGSGERTTRLDAGDSVIPHVQTKEILKNIETQKIIREMELTGHLSDSIRKGKQDEMIYVMAKAMEGNQINEKALRGAFRDAVKDIPVQQWISDERGQRLREKTVNQTTTYLNNLTKF